MKTHKIYREHTPCSTLYTHLTPLVQTRSGTTNLLRRTLLTTGASQNVYSSNPIFTFIFSMYTQNPLSRHTDLRILRFQDHVGIPLRVCNIHLQTLSPYGVSLNGRSTNETTELYSKVHYKTTVMVLRLHPLCPLSRPNPLLTPVCTKEVTTTVSPDLKCPQGTCTGSIRRLSVRRYTDSRTRSGYSSVVTSTISSEHQDIDAVRRVTGIEVITLQPNSLQ